MLLKQMYDLNRLVENMKKQGKSKNEIKQTINLYLVESKKKINSNGDFDVV